MRIRGRLSLVVLFGVMLLASMPSSAAAAAPTCEPVAPVSVASGADVRIDLACSDVDLDPIDLVVTTPAALGTVSAVGSDVGGTFVTYTAAPLYNATSGSDSFTVTATAASDPVETAALVVPVTVTSPVLCWGAPSTLRIRPGATRQISTNCNFPGLPVTFSIQQQGAHGTATSQFGSITYSADPGAGVLVDSIVVRYDMAGSFRDVTIPIEIDPAANELPSCYVNNPGTNVRAGAERTLSIQCNDADNDNLTVTAASDPAGATLTQPTLLPPPAPLNTRSMTFTAPLALGTFAIVLTIDDGRVAPLVEQRVDFTVVDAASNTAPSCSSTFTITTTAGAMPVTLQPYCTDAEGDQVTLREGTTAPTKGALSDLNGQLRYTANAGTSGTDTFTLIPNDGTDDGAEITVEATIQSPQITCNAAPVELRPGASRQTFANCYSSDMSPVTTTIETGADPSVASVTMPYPGQLQVFGIAVGTTQVVVRATTPGDPTGVTVTVPISVSASANEQPTCGLMGANTGVRVNATRTFQLWCNDLDNDPLTVTTTVIGGGAATQPTPAQGSGFQFDYTAPATPGSASIQIAVTDTVVVAPVVSTVQLTIYDAVTNTAPGCYPVTWMSPVYAGGLATSINVQCSDVEGDAITLIPGSSAPTKGDITFPPGLGYLSVNYAARAGESGSDSFTVIARDALGAESPQIPITLNIAQPQVSCTPPTSINRRPLTTSTAMMNCFSPDMQMVTLAVETAPDPAFAQASIVWGSTLQVTAIAAGTTSVAVRASTASNPTGVLYTIPIDVSLAHNSLPTCSANASSGFHPSGPGVRVGRDLAYSYSCSDQDGDPIAVTIVQALGGAATVAATNGTFGTGTFTAGGIAMGATVQLQASDGFGVSLFALTLTIYDDVVNTAPTCSTPTIASTVYSGVGLASISLQSCTDREGDPLQFDVVTQPQHRDEDAVFVASTWGKQFAYEPTAGYAGTDSITYRAGDDRGAWSPNVEQTLNVQDGSLQCPAVAPTVDVRVGGRQSPFPCTAWGMVQHSIVTGADPAVAAVTVSADGYGLTIEGVAVGTTSVTIAVTDDYTAQPKIVIIPITVSTTANQAPTCDAYIGSMRAGATRTITTRCWDFDGDAVTLALDPADLPQLVTVDAISALQPTGEFGALEGTLSVTAGAATGFEDFYLVATDAQGGTAAAYSNATIVAATAHTAPTCPDYPATVAANSVETQLWFGCGDAEGDAIVHAIAAGPTHGTFLAGSLVAKGEARYQPDPGFVGTDQFEVTATDADGTTTFTQRIDVVDQDPATTTITAAPTGTVAGADATIVFAADEVGATFVCSLDGAPFSACSSPFELTGLAEGAHRLRVRSYDAARNRERTPVAAEWTLDATAPSTTIGAAPASLTNSSTASFEFSSNEPGTFECRLDGGSWAACSSPHPLTGLADGPHAFDVRAIDAAGNTGNEASSTWTIDATAPDTTITSGPTGAVATSTAAFTFVGDDPTDTFECKLDAGAWSVCTSPHSPPPLVDGTYTLQVRASDLAGNTDQAPATRTWTVDTIAPETTIATGPAPLTSSTTAALTFTASEASTFECDVDGAGYQPCASPLELTALGEGAHAISIRARDLAGNADPSPVSRGWTVDTVAPTTDIDSAPGATLVVDEATIEFSSSDASATFACAVDGGAWAPCESPFELANLADGPHVVLVRASDPAGNTEAPAQTVTFDVDTTSPVVSIVSGPNAVTASNAASIGFTTDDPTAVVECIVDGVTAGACTSPYGLSGLADGTHTLELVATDPAGNTGALVQRSWRVDTTAPGTTIDGAPSAVSGVAEPVFEFSSPEPGVTFACSIDGASFAACSSPFTATALADGARTFAVRAIDEAGNVDASPAQHAWTRDTTAPQSTITNGPTGTVASSTAAFTFVGVDPSDTFECSIDGGAWSLCTSPHSPPPLADGSHTLQVRASDLAGNTDTSPAERTWTVDTTGPITTISSAPSGTSTATSATVRFAANETATFACSVDGGGFTTCTSPLELTGLGAGVHSIDVRATDPAGNLGTSVSRSWTIDAAAPIEVSAVVTAGGQVQTDTTAPLQVAATIPQAGTVTIERRTTPVTAEPVGYALLGQELQITAPEATDVAAPLRFVFTLAAAQIPAGTDLSTLRVVRNGTPVTAACAGETAVPSPCELSRATTGGELRITVLTMQASAWVFARVLPVVTPTPDPKPDPTPPTNPTATPPATPIATRLTATSARVQRYSCPKSEVRFGVRVGTRVWCHRLLAQAQVVRSDGGAPVAGQRVFVYRVVRGQLLVGSFSTDRQGFVKVRRRIDVPAAQRRTLAAATRWLGQQYRLTRFRHVASGEFSNGLVVTVPTLR